MYAKISLGKLTIIVKMIFYELMKYSEIRKVEIRYFKSGHSIASIWNLTVS